MAFDWKTAKRVGNISAQILKDTPAGDIQLTKGRETIPEGTAVSASQGLSVSPRTQQKFDPKGNIEITPQDNPKYKTFDDTQTDPVTSAAEELVEDMTDPHEQVSTTSEDTSVEGTIIDTFSDQQLNPETGLVFAYLESSLDPNAKAGSTSAEGLFQFTNSTWNDMIRQHGKKYGIDKSNANKFDPFQSAAMGAEYVRFNSERLEAHGHDVNDTNLYLYHFMGPTGGRKFLEAFEASPKSPVSTAVSRKAIESNPTIFKNSDGSIRTVNEVYNYLNKKVENARGNVQGILEDKLRTSQNQIG